MKIKQRIQHAGLVIIECHNPIHRRQPDRPITRMDRGHLDQRAQPGNPRCPVEQRIRPPVQQ